jgi:hypothetical protein
VGEADDNRHTLSYTQAGRRFRWSAAKAAWLRDNRGVDFLDVEEAIADSRLLDFVRHPNAARYGHQWLLIVLIRDYVYLVPAVEEADGWFLKTIIPSRKATRDWLSKGDGA